MAEYGRDETIATWVGDFSDTTSYAALPAPAKEYASEILQRFLERACAERDVAPAELVASDMKPGLLEGVGALELPASVRAVSSDLCSSFVTELEVQGRLANGRMLGVLLRALSDAFEPKPIRNRAAKLGRNDPCPCGSGLKYKRCCMGREL